MIPCLSLHDGWVARKLGEPYERKEKKTISDDERRMSRFRILTAVDVLLVGLRDLALVLVRHGLRRERRAIDIAGRVHRLLQRVAFPAEEVVSVTSVT